MALSLARSERLIRVAKAKSKEMGIKVSISVVDPRGDLIAMVRQDGARWITMDVSRGKAMASAVFGVPSGELTQRAETPVFRSLVTMHGGHIVPGQGALPVTRGNEVIGGIGVSGGTGQEDEDVARAALSAL